jgi:hypothetical protein
MSMGVGVAVGLEQAASKRMKSVVREMRIWSRLSEEIRFNMASSNAEL